MAICPRNSHSVQTATVPSDLTHPRHESMEKFAVGRDPDHKETDQAQQVEVVLVGGFFGEESIGETEKE
jgi:hypothetical protein